MSKEWQYFLSLLEAYARYKNKKGNEIFLLWQKADIIDFINDMYFLYHQEADQNAFDDIDAKLRELNYSF